MPDLNQAEIDVLCGLVFYLLVVLSVLALVGTPVGRLFELMTPWGWQRMQARRARKRYERECAGRGVRP